MGGFESPDVPSNRVRREFAEEMRTEEVSPASEYKFAALQDDFYADDETYVDQSTSNKVATITAYAVASILAFYIFMVAIKFIEDGFTLALGCDSKGAFEFANNPVAGLVVGTIATALLHSSGTVTSTIVAIVGAGGMTIRQGVYVVMGANIGTSITCVMVAFGYIGDRICYQRAMSAALLHDLYNVWSVIILFPLEILFHPLEALSTAMSHAKTSGGDFKSPVEAIVNPLTELLIKVNKDAIYAVASGEAQCDRSLSFVKAGPFLNSSLSDRTVGAIIVCTGFFLLVCSLIVLVKTLGKVFLAPTKKTIAQILDYNGYVNIVAGTVITFIVHSSTVVTSTITPMAGLGVITLEQVYPIMLGANLGTTATALLASLVTGKSDAVAIALVHFWFNVFGIPLFYPIPITRKPIFSWSKAIGYWSACWPMAGVLFLLGLFLGVPGLLWGLVAMCLSSSEAVVVAGYISSGIVILALILLVYWYHRRGGRERWHAFLDRKCEEHQVLRHISGNHIFHF